MRLSQLATKKLCHHLSIHHILEVQMLKDFDKILMANCWVAIVINLFVGKITINLELPITIMVPLASGKSLAKNIF